jgi:hypothetical protein
VRLAAARVAEQLGREVQADDVRVRLRGADRRIAGAGRHGEQLHTGLDGGGLGDGGAGVPEQLRDRVAVARAPDRPLQRLQTGQLVAHRVLTLMGNPPEFKRRTVRRRRFVRGF